MENENEKRSLAKEIFLPAGVILAIIIAGGVSGYFLADKTKEGNGQAVKLREGVETVQSSKEVGIKDARVFKDDAAGKIEINTKGDEGSHLLLRSGGPSQTAHLTSSVVDLNGFIGKCVQVWGETQSAQKAGWLMDVGRVKILDTCPEGL